MKKILDSGNRREFVTGAVRDMQEGKGRCDLLPLEVAAALTADPVLLELAKYQQSPKWEHLAGALWAFMRLNGWDVDTLLLEVAVHFEEGAKKYGDNNWRKGIPSHCYIDSAVRHYLKWRRKDDDEPHDRAFCWNLLCCAWTCEHHPDLNDYAEKEAEK